MHYNTVPLIHNLTFARVLLTTCSLVDYMILACACVCVCVCVVCVCVCVCVVFTGFAAKHMQAHKTIHVVYIAVYT